MKHFASRDFWKHHAQLPAVVQAAANKNYELLKQNPGHPSPHFKKVGRLHSVRVGLWYRALGVEIPEGVLGFWIGAHAAYDKLVG